MMELAGRYAQQDPGVPIYVTQGDIRSPRSQRNAPTILYATPGSKGPGFGNINTSRMF